MAPDLIGANTRCREFSGDSLAVASRNAQATTVLRDGGRWSTTALHCARVCGLGALTPGAGYATDSVVCIVIVLHLDSELASLT